MRVEFLARRTLPTVDLVISRQGNTFLEASVRVSSPADVVSGDEHAKGAIEVCYGRKPVSTRFVTG
jgi:hypothetical protein